MSLDDYLEGDDAKEMSDAEKVKLARRKAHDLAVAERELASKRSEKPSVEDILADMVRVAEDRACNPFYKDRTLSAKRYKRFGHYPIDYIYREFGQFEHAKQVAKLVDGPGDRAKKSARSEQSRREHAGRYVERHIRPYVQAPDSGPLSKTRLVLSISDTHAHFLSAFTWHCFLRACKALEPDVIYLNGDIIEGAEIARFPKIRGWTTPLHSEFDFAREMFRQLRRVCPDAEIWWGAGNHGLDRIAMFLTTTAANALMGFDSLRFDKLAGVDDYDIKLSQGGTLLSPKGTEEEQPGTTFHGFYTVYHGVALGQNPMLTELRNEGRSGQSGHVHRAGLAYSTTESGGAMSWMSTPMGCTPVAGRSYMFKRRNTGWQEGFGVAWLHPGGRVHQYPVVTSGGVAMFEGICIENEGMEQPDPTGLWVADTVMP